ncbi:hypothetical protein LCGC14_1712320 [marine sediment metagenome]|uniref:Uncharacterized protein n=1 Tax=marine sediment metagenome TaxID=412755 RepID=A0A0F9KEV8_9ZZZZ
MEGTDEEIKQPVEDQDEFEDEDFSEEDDSDEGFEEDYDWGGSEPTSLGGIYGLFKEVNDEKDTKIVSNLNKEELGNLGISVRECKRIALLANTFGHPIFAKYFINQAGIISDSSMSKSGWFTELFVTSKRYASRESSSKVDALPQYSKGKWKIGKKGEITNPKQYT